MQIHLLVEVGGGTFCTSIPFYVGSACVRENLEVGGVGFTLCAVQLSGVRRGGDGRPPGN